MPRAVTSKTALAKSLLDGGAVPEGPRQPVWKGPQVDGVTYSLLSRYLTCPERFRLLVMEGLKPAPQFSQRLEYGNLWHVCEEAYAETNVIDGDGCTWPARLKEYASQLCKTYRMQQEQVIHWYNVCRTQFPIYVRYWQDHPDVLNRTPIMQETTFSTAYRLPSIRVIRLRGKFDSVDMIDGALWVQENKSKGDVYEDRMHRQLLFDLQTMLYVVALIDVKNDAFWNRSHKRWRRLPIGGVRYNVVRRPLSGGKHTIRQHKPTKANPKGESLTQYYQRLGGLIASDPEHYFMRWKLEITPSDINRFKQETLNPVLENLYDDYEWWDWCFRMRASVWDYLRRRKVFPKHRARHYRLPFGIYNALLESGSTDLDEYLSTGSEAGLTRVDNLFPEL